MPYSAAKIANRLLAIAGAQGDHLTPLKLLKLVYIAHGWSFVHLAQPLLNEPAQAWQYGPVIPSLYHAISRFRGQPVTEPVADSDPQSLDAEADALLQSVYTTYGSLSAVQLSNLTHLPNSPWYDAWHSRGRNAVISDAAIARHYSSLSAARASAA